MRLLGNNNGTKLLAQFKSRIRSTCLHRVKKHMSPLILES